MKVKRKKNRVQYILVALGGVLAGKTNRIVEWRPICPWWGPSRLSGPVPASESHGPATQPLRKTQEAVTNQPTFVYRLAGIRKHYFSSKQRESGLIKRYQLEMLEFKTREYVTA